MITIRSGKLVIPEDERFIGFAGDNSVVEKQFKVFQRAAAGCMYTLCLRFDSSAVRSVPLEARISGGDTLLTWTVDSEDIPESGIVTAQIKMSDGFGTVEHTTKDYFLADSSVELDDGGAEIETVTPSQLESRVAQAVSDIESRRSYLGDDGFWYVFKQSTQSFVKTDYRENLHVDSQMSLSSTNPVTNSAIKAYVDGQISSVRSEISGIEAELSQI